MLRVLGNISCDLDTKDKVKDTKVDILNGVLSTAV